MLKYLTTMTLGFSAGALAAASTTTTSSTGICSADRVKEEQSVGSDQSPPHPQHQSSQRLIPGDKSSSSAASSSVASTDNDTIMDYRQEADRIANKVYEIYNDTDWKLAKTNVSTRYHHLLKLSCY